MYSSHKSPIQTFTAEGRATFKATEEAASAHHSWPTWAKSVGHTSVTTIRDLRSLERLPLEKAGSCPSCRETLSYWKDQDRTSERFDGCREPKILKLDTNLPVNRFEGPGMPNSRPT